jgi:outer membrane protein OmpA-like peptidoglycan-associated protein
MSIKIFKKLTDAQIKDLSKGVVEVEAKTMNATALGIVDALLRIYPEVTFAELKEMLPDEINPGFDKFGNANENGKKYDSLFKPNGERLYGVIQPGSIRQESEKRNLILSKSHFTGEGQTFKTADGVEVLVSYKWESKDAVTGESDIENLIKHVAQYGVKVVSFESAKPFKKGEYSINVINPALMNSIQNPPKKKFPWWILILLLLLIFGILFFLTRKEVKDEEISKEETVLPVGENYKAVSPLEEIQSRIKAGENTEGQSVHFHEILFEKDSDVLLPESEFYLNEVFQVMSEIPALKLLVVGHTSSEGEDNYNLKLSSKRALAVAAYLQSKGVDSERLSTDGKGASLPIASNDTEEGRRLNRRIEFSITDDGNENN